MSGSGVKKVVDMAAKAARSGIDWDGMAKMLVSEEARKEFATLRRAFDDVNHTLQTKYSMEPEPIDWEYYRKGIGSRLVDMYKQAYESIEIPKFVDTVTPEYKPKFDALVPFTALAHNKQWSSCPKKQVGGTERGRAKVIERVGEVGERNSRGSRDEEKDQHHDCR